ncbi:hypothetical protein NDI76_10385 [Halogeometricum sp. S1BR25-6]|uniref:DUF7344 domain-containing protein n=1 Tax=Halogeometricum salsisoli TaxID=2950536 RepID=A0ABU2GFA4_9EURY|nr:hypothetical protein [Halogeometricum sp. S1BR25-6]MDS0299151.1 hypothetical protein [Halogeometricum sp. S1BR25-6]
MSVQRVFADDEAERLTKDDIYSMLSNRRRRLVLNHLRRTEEEVSVRDLSEEVAALENGIGAEEVTYKQRKRVYTSLHQTHLPKLDDVGVVVYDRDRGTISLTPLSTQLDSFLADADEAPRSTPWPAYYLGLSTLSILLVALAWTRLFPFSLLPDLGYGLLIGLGFAASAALHVYAERRAEAHETPRSLALLTDLQRRDGD